MYVLRQILPWGGGGLSALLHKLPLISFWGGFTVIYLILYFSVTWFTLVLLNKYISSIIPLSTLKFLQITGVHTGIVFTQVPRK